MEWVRVRNKVLGFSSVKVSKVALAIPYGIILARLFSLSLSAKSIWGGENAANLCLFTSNTFV